MISKTNGFWVACGGFERPYNKEGEIRSATFQVVATPGQQAADINSRLGVFVAAHRTMPFLHPPANGSSTAIVRAIHRLALGSLSDTIAGQSLPQTPAVEKEDSQTIGHYLFPPATERVSQVNPLDKPDDIPYNAPDCGDSSDR